MTDRVRPLSFQQAQTCETAREPKCVCRCGGVLHGAARSSVEQLELRGFYEHLPDEDPHRIPSEKERKELASLRSMRTSLVRARARFPRMWNRADEIHLSRVEKTIIRLEYIVLGIRQKEPAQPVPA